jgi:hypothetical protein
MTTPIEKTAHACRWAVPTLFLPLPDWLDAWDTPWTCRRDPQHRTLESTDECRTCLRWEARAAPGTHWPLAFLGI